MAANLTTDMVRAVLQLPLRPYSDPRVYDSTKYYDLTAREIVSVIQASGTAAGGAHIFQTPNDFLLTNGCIDWSPAGVKPDLGTQFVVDYWYSPLSSATAAQAVSTAQSMVTQELGSAYPYASTSAEGVSTDALATIGQLYFACREACTSLAVSDIVNASKYRRGSVLIDDTHKTTDWQDMADKFGSKYKEFLRRIRPAGMVRAFAVTKRDVYSLVFEGDGGFTGADQRAIVDMILTGNSYGGIL